MLRSNIHLLLRWAWRGVVLNRTDTGITWVMNEELYPAILKKGNYISSLIEACMLVADFFLMPFIFREQNSFLFLVNSQFSWWFRLWFILTSGCHWPSTRSCWCCWSHICNFSCASCKHFIWPACSFNENQLKHPYHKRVRFIISRLLKMAIKSCAYLYMPSPMWFYIEWSSKLTTCLANLKGKKLNLYGWLWRFAYMAFLSIACSSYTAATNSLGFLVFFYFIVERFCNHNRMFSVGVSGNCTIDS
jgi:hypothetical protein